MSEIKTNEEKMKLEELEKVNGGNIIDDVMEGVERLKDAIEKQIKHIPRGDNPEDKPNNPV